MMHQPDCASLLVAAWALRTSRQWRSPTFVNKVLGASPSIFPLHRVQHFLRPGEENLPGPVGHGRGASLPPSPRGPRGTDRANADLKGPAQQRARPYISCLGPGGYLTSSLTITDITSSEMSKLA